MEKYSWQKKENERREQRRPQPKQRQAIIKKDYRIKKVSTKQSLELRVYSVLAKDYLLDHPFCECGREGCKRKSDEVHHTKGRGTYLNVVELFKALSKVCHRWAHDNHAEASGLGLFILKNGKNKI